MDTLTLSFIGLGLCPLFYIIPRLLEWKSQTKQKHKEVEVTTKAEKFRPSILHKILLTIGIIRMKKNA